MAWAKGQPGKLSYGSTGTMTSPHLTMELIAQQLGLELLHALQGQRRPDAVHPGRADRAAGLHRFCAAGRGASCACSTPGGAERLAKFPDAPTLGSWASNLVQNSPLALAPKGTPDAVVKRLHDAFKQAMEQDSYKTALARYDMVPCT